MSKPSKNTALAKIFWSYEILQQGLTLEDELDDIEWFEDRDLVGEMLRRLSPSPSGFIFIPTVSQI